MDLVTLLKHGHQVILNAVAELSPTEWGMEGVCGTWSAKDIIGHLASLEHFQIELVSARLDRKLEMPHLEQLGNLGLAGFNTKQTEIRRDTPHQAVRGEYIHAFEQLLQLMKQLPDELLHQPELGSFYVEGYSLADFFVHGIYGHKREHAAQIVCFHEFVRANAS